MKAWWDFDGKSRRIRAVINAPGGGGGQRLPLSPEMLRRAKRRLNSRTSTGIDICETLMLGFHVALR